jgi:hypothetical protein
MLVIKGGALFRLGPQEKADEIVSPFAVEKIEAERRQWEKQSWKAATNPEEETAIVSRSMLWGSRGGGAGGSTLRPQVKVCRQLGDRLYYVIALSKAQGLFYLDLKQQKEFRLFHREEFDPQGLSLAPDFSVYTTQTNRDVTRHLVKMNEEGKGVTVVTSGDCRDENPWIDGQFLYYQSVGIARTPEGVPAAFGPAAINRLDLKTGDVQTLKEEADRDFLLPRTDASGNLYFIERPHVTGAPSPGFLAIVKDVVLFPYRLVVAILAFLNVFSLFFSKKPLMTAGGPETPEIDLSHRFIHGQLVNTVEAARQAGRKVVVGSDWRLIRRSPDGREETLATHVIAFDIAPDGRIAFSDGYSVYDTAGAVLHCSEEIITFLHCPPAA